MKEITFEVRFETTNDNGEWNNIYVLTVKAMNKREAITKALAELERKDEYNGPSAWLLEGKSIRLVEVEEVIIWC